ncbi:hypothetical protein E2P81_ATG06124 [Venturia nashicola]|uniref:Uncharacterized protein n=1 Tax=Venturia nashicola TaxID=86259 RepID=A0A4Z1NSX6_9PEZI|nr:hypothetical protein E6O75_ATG06263 [Venturia nashicola]TLD29830.1 hypothetical protein E2P81_ATG06124 [Venturia nashicola]
MPRAWLSPISYAPYGTENVPLELRLSEMILMDIAVIGKAALVQPCPRDSIATVRAPVEIRLCKSSKLAILVSVIDILDYDSCHALLSDKYETLCSTNREVSVEN